MLSPGAAQRDLGRVREARSMVFTPATRTTIHGMAWGIAISR